jgi:hypothetical protein
MFGRILKLLVVGSVIALQVLIAALSDTPAVSASETRPATFGRVAAITLSPTAPSQTPLVTKVGACPKGKGVCEGSGQMWCCPSYPNYPYCSCGNFPGSCSGTCY